MTIKNKKICHAKPIRAIIERKPLTYLSASEVTYTLPCGIKYTDKHEVHCGKFETCEYYRSE